MVASILLPAIPAGSMVWPSSSKEVGGLEPELPWLAGTAGLGNICCYSNQCSVHILPRPQPWPHTPLYKVAKHQHKENQWQMDWILLFASSRSGIMQPGFEGFSSTRLMRSPWEFVNRHRRWNCHISLAPLFGLSSEITQRGFSGAQGNHEFSTHYTYPLHLFYCAPHSKWHLIVLGEYLFLCKLP